MATLAQQLGEWDALTTEERRVHDWRREQFEKLGCDEFVAEAPADTEADLGVARRLIAAGCPVATMALIVG